MSLIERALQKARVRARPSHDETAPVDTPVQEPRTVPILSTHETPSSTGGFPRVVASPELRITDELLRAHGLRGEDEDQAQQRAEYRHVKHGLMAELRAPDARRVVLITSALQGEGKSFSAFQLAMSLAVEPDFTVLLVDADVIRPNLTRTFGLTGRLGLMDAVADEKIDVQSLIVTTDVEGLSILPAGRPHENATEYFASARMHAVVEQLLSVPNRIVVIDSLPLLLTTEARALAALAGQIVLVVRAERTPQSSVHAAIGLLEDDANVKLLLNAMVRTKALSYLGTEYGYGYEYSARNKP
jgi:protein-tyrosine kinase